MISAVQRSLDHNEGNTDMKTIANSLPLLIGFAFFLSTVVCFPAIAGDQSVNQGPRTIVKFGDLDLNTDAGRREVLNRLSRAANRVCAEYASLIDVTTKAKGNLHAEYLNSSSTWAKEIRSCYDRTLAAAVDKVHDAQLSQVAAK